jgi:hypothetical protein
VVGLTRGSPGWPPVGVDAQLGWDGTGSAVALGPANGPDDGRVLLVCRGPVGGPVGARGGTQSVGDGSGGVVWPVVVGSEVGIGVVLRLAVLVDSGIDVGGVAVGRVAVGGAFVGGVDVGRVAVGRVAVGGAFVGGVDVGRVAVGRVAVGGAFVGGVDAGGAFVGGVDAGAFAVGELVADVVRDGGRVGLGAGAVVGADLATGPGPDTGGGGGTGALDTGPEVTPSR